MTFWYCIFAATIYIYNEIVLNSTTGKRNIEIDVVDVYKYIYMYIV